MPTTAAMGRDVRTHGSTSPIRVNWPRDISIYASVMVPYGAGPSKREAWIISRVMCGSSESENRAGSTSRRWVPLTGRTASTRP